MKELIEGLNVDQLRVGLRVLVIVIVGFALARLLNRRLPVSRLHPQHQLLLRRAAGYIVLALTLVTVLRELGLSLSVFLGAAGILTVAIGFAAQTAASNLISGLFLMGERPFLVGDVITVDGTTGEVVSIDLLSVKLRTFDNLLVRMPNETMLRAKVTNLSHFPIRRLDMKIGVAYKEDIERVRQVLQDVADRNPICFKEPAPLLIFLGYGESSLDFQFSVWGTRENHLLLRNSMHELVKRQFDEEGIEIPFPHRSLYAGSVTEPIPVRIADAK